MLFLQYFNVKNNITLKNSTVKTTVKDYKATDLEYSVEAKGYAGTPQKQLFWIFKFAQG